MHLHPTRTFQFLKKNSQNDINLYVKRLLKKYKNSLVNAKAIQKLKRASCQYQPKTKNYKRIVIRKLNPELWKQLKELKSLTGYSISYILRVILEWEMEDSGIQIQPLLPQNHSERNDQQMNSQLDLPSLLPLDNYFYCQYWERRNHSLISIFLDFP